MIEKEDEELSSVTSFFSKRAKLVARVSPEEIKAATELLNKAQEEKSKLSNDKNVLFPIKSTKKSVRDKKSKKVNPSLKAIPDDDNVENKPAVVSTSDVKHITTFSSCDVELSAAAKRRLMKEKKKLELELRSIEAENERVLSAIQTPNLDEVVEVPLETVDNVNVLTISYKSEVSRLKCYDTDKFSTIFPKVAELFKLEVSEFLLSFKEQIINVDDTPKSLNITTSDVLECIPYKADGKAESETQYDANNLKILFQSNDSKNKIQMVVHKLEKMQNIMEKYSQQRDIPLNLLVFEFDGEKISGTETPDDLEMESGNTIDVRILIPLSQEKASSPKKIQKKVTPKKKTPRKNNKRGRKGQKQVDIVTVDSDSDDSTECYVI